MIFVFSVECWILCKRGDFKYFMDCLFEIMYDYMISSIASHGFVLKMILVLFHLINLNLILGGWILLQLPQVNFKWSCFSLSSKQMNRPPNTISRELFPRGALIFTITNTIATYIIANNWRQIYYKQSSPLSITIKWSFSWNLFASKQIHMIVG